MFLCNRLYIRYALNVPTVKEFFSELKVMNLHEIFITKELYKD